MLGRSRSVQPADANPHAADVRLPRNIEQQQNVKPVSKTSRTSDPNLGNLGVWPRLPSSGVRVDSETPRDLDEVLVSGGKRSVNPPRSELISRLDSGYRIWVRQFSARLMRALELPPEKSWEFSDDIESTQGDKESKDVDEYLEVDEYPPPAPYKRRNPQTRSELISRLDSTHRFWVEQFSARLMRAWEFHPEKEFSDDIESKTKGDKESKDVDEYLEVDEYPPPAPCIPPIPQRSQISKACIPSILQYRRFGGFHNKMTSKNAGKMRPFTQSTPPHGKDERESAPQIQAQQEQQAHQDSVLARKLRLVRLTLEEQEDSPKLDTKLGP